MLSFTLETLGDVLGSSFYLGMCRSCGSQFMSTHDRVARVAHIMICDKCAHAIKVTHEGKSLTGGDLWHVKRNGKLIGHIVLVCGSLYIATDSRLKDFSPKSDLSKSVVDLIMEGR